MMNELIWVGGAFLVGVPVLILLYLVVIYIQVEWWKHTNKH